MESTAQTITIREETRSGDPFFAAAKDSCSSCFRGYLTITIEEDDEETYVVIPCKSSQPGNISAHRERRYLQLTA